jgi:hypothetical protein
VKTLVDRHGPNAATVAGLALRSALFHEVLKSDRRRVRKKSLKAKYGVEKEVAAGVTEQYSEISDQYRQAKRSEIGG